MDIFDFAGRLGTACLRCIPAETAHDIGMFFLSKGGVNILPDPVLLNHQIKMTTEIPGVGLLRHPIGLAAGFDKNARCPHSFQKMGFSFLELGTVTPRPQPGNPKPRLFRDSGQRAIVNRMGFNSDGGERVAARLRSHQWSLANIPLGINLGKNKDTPSQRAVDDYVNGIERFQSLAHYFVINISSPNTPGLRDLATPTFIENLAVAIGNERKRAWIKLDPDMDRRSFQELILTIKAQEFSGVILSNTHRVEYPQAGGQSGHPLLSPSNSMLERAWEVHQGSLPMIASGGVLSGIDAFHKIARGACAIQIYTALVYRGPGAVARIHEELALELKLRNIANLQDAIGCWYKE